jgi:uncharacterized protein Yka (UPF0111/DUF47 family)
MSVLRMIEAKHRMKESLVDQRERFEKIRKAVEDLDRFLEEHPELKPLQEEIEKRLRGAGSIENRIDILRSMIDEKLFDLRQACLKAKKLWEGSSWTCQ